jgi:pyruvate dehydrogenase E1 component beta subunit
MPIEGAAIRRPGTDCSIITWRQSEEGIGGSGENLWRENINCEVIDLRALRPLMARPYWHRVEKPTGP